MSFRQVKWSAIVLPMVLVPSIGHAQRVTGSFDELQRIVEPNRSVIVTDNAGQKTKGKIVEISTTSLTLVVKRTPENPTGRRMFTQDSVLKVARTDSLLNGTFIGVGIGVAAALIFTRSVCSPDPECRAIADAIGFGAFVPSGAVAGALIDRAIGNGPIYVAPSRASRVSLGVSPLLGRTGRGIALSVRF